MKTFASVTLVVGPLLETAECVLVEIQSNGRISMSSGGKTISAGTPSPSFRFSLSIFAQRRLASEGISKLGGLGGPNEANEIDFGLGRCELHELSPTMASNGGEPGIVSSVGLTDAMADGGLWAIVLEVSLSKGGGLRMGLRARHESAELMVSV